MNLKLNIFNSQKRFKRKEENERLDELEKQVYSLNDEGTTYGEKIDIMSKFYREISENKVTSRRLKLIKKFETDVILGGGFLDIPMEGLLIYVKMMEKLLIKDYSSSPYIDVIKDIRDLHQTVLGKELQDLLKNYEIYFDGNPSEKIEWLLYNILESDLYSRDGKLPHFDIINKILIKCSGVDLINREDCWTNSRQDIY